MSTMKHDPIPRTYRRVTPSLVVKGGVKALEFYAEVFGATERMRIPGPDGTVAHSEVEIGDSIVLLTRTSLPTSDRSTGDVRRLRGRLDPPRVGDLQRLPLHGLRVGPPSGRLSPYVPSVLRSTVAPPTRRKGPKSAILRIQIEVRCAADRGRRRAPRVRVLSAALAAGTPEEHDHRIPLACMASRRGGVTPNPPHSEPRSRACGRGSTRARPTTCPRGVQERHNP